MFFFFHFKVGRFDISYTPRSGRLSEIDENRLNILIHNDPRQCSLELANVMNCDQSIIVRQIKRIIVEALINSLIQMITVSLNIIIC